MTSNWSIRTTIEKELGYLYDNATLAATTPVLFTRDNAIETAADRIIAIVREALLADESVKAMLYTANIAVFTETDSNVHTPLIANEREMMAAAFDVAFGADDDGGEG